MSTLLCKHQAPSPASTPAAPQHALLHLFNLMRSLGIVGIVVGAATGIIFLVNSINNGAIHYFFNNHVRTLSFGRWLHSQSDGPFYDPSNTPYAQLFENLQEQGPELRNEWLAFTEKYDGSSAPLIGNILPDHAGFNRLAKYRWSFMWLRMFGHESELFQEDFPRLYEITKDIAVVAISVTHKGKLYIFWYLCILKP